MKKLAAAIVGSGNIGTDLMIKLLRSPWLEARWMIGIDPESDGLRRAAKLGLEASAEGLKAVLDRGARPDVVFDATSAKAHVRHARLLREAGIQAIDLTPAARGPYVIAAVNLKEHLNSPNVNMVTCGGQATVPMVYAVSRVVPVRYAEIVATIASKSAGPGTRQNIDEFTQTTARALESIAGAKRGKAIIILNPADPPILMRDTVYCMIEEASKSVVDRVLESIHEMVRQVQTYVPGYRLNRDPIVMGNVVSISLEVEGLGDYLPVYAGNLDIMTAAAVKFGEEYAKYKLAAEGVEIPR
ncbi:acetaldehyde dehydrogenase (acetylating) [Alicyclobacillus mali]|uniref:Acetaldehyde dehydrogenase n=2 Tax=Alicyclobacillus mali (ex Roth et al. 2021) TaxID=1123961 RepID=A0ABS0F2W7_9BACL|nr:acetaldehyde dehydrogenase (acetylating) [Alicyclobacillus mali (ex Roth et al. 2021)]MBF8377645.1 acetaldehyde dehydrogenase (acetylating) [Alicyclobacillus mali (ex Roth et al. 2021)]MCL6487819.1 acetaldehyde dehydrogenase (acetylating) [Alicyclobacillus mali (ex Roth et al. 2021)]